MHFLGIIPKPLLTLLIVVVVMALIPSVLPMLVGMALTDFDVVLGQVKRIALPGAMTAGALAAVVHFSPLHKVHAIALFEGSLLGLTLLAVVLVAYPWLDAHYPVWISTLTKAVGG